jgi:hypothetical protein
MKGEHPAMTATADSLNVLRSRLIEAVGKDTGWEESAVHMVDNVVLPVLLQHEADHPHAQALDISPERVQDRANYMRTEPAGREGGEGPLFVRISQGQI